MKLHKKIAHAFGYELISSKKISDYQTAPDDHLRILLARSRIDHVIDVGANNGQFALSLRSLGFEGRISSIEPTKTCFAHLQQLSKSDSKWQIHQFALGKENTQTEINVYANDNLSSFRKFNNYSEKRFSSKGRELISRESVEVCRLDSVICKLGIQAGERLHLKLDTQGFDLEVFEGAERLLSQIHSLQSELSIIPIYQGSPDYIQALTVYRKAGFELTGFFPISGDRGSMVLVEGDGYMCKREA